MNAKTYRDRVKCPAKHSFVVVRRTSTAGKTVGTFCQVCSRMYKIKAGPVPAIKNTKD